MTKSVVVTGWGNSGSWEVRGRQLGSAMGARVEWRVQHAELLTDADVVIYIKRVNNAALAAIRASGKPWVWDIVDAWPNPGDNRWDKKLSLIWLQGELRRLRPNAIVVPTKMMLHDSGWEGKSLVLPHHAWPKYKPYALREKVVNVGYEGMTAYLGKWNAMLQEECKLRGWNFSIGDLSDSDIGIALRNDTSYANKFWKSNCKLANIQALGIPAVCSSEESYQEFGSGEESFVETRGQLVLAFDRLSDVKERSRIRSQMVAAAPRLESVAKEYSEWLALNF